jgi:hypothetical protein
MKTWVAQQEYYPVLRHWRLYLKAQAMWDVKAEVVMMQQRWRRWRRWRRFEPAESGTTAVQAA